MKSSILVVVMIVVGVVDVVDSFTTPCHPMSVSTSSHLTQGVGENLWVEMCDSNCVHSKYLGSLSGTLIMIST